MGQPELRMHSFEEEPPPRRGVQWLVGLAIVAIVGAAVAVTWSLTREGNAPAPKPSASVQPSTQPTTPIDPTAGWVRYTSPYGYVLRHPPTWKATRFEGHDELYPPGVPSLARGGDTFAVDVTTKSLSGGPDCTLVANSLTIGGRSVPGCESTSATGERNAWYQVSMPGGTYVAHLLGSTQVLWNTYATTGRQILQTMSVVPSPKVTHGGIASSVRRDALSTGLVGFLEARVAGEGTDFWMSDNAQGLFVNRPNGLTLYGWSSYRIIARRDVDANSSEFDVTLTASNGAIEKETIGVGPGANIAGIQRTAVVRFAVRK